MIAKLLRTRRTRQLAKAINSCLVDEVIALLDKGVDLDNFMSEKPDPIPHAPEHTTQIRNVLQWAAMCHLPARGIEALVQAGAPYSKWAADCAYSYARGKDAGPWKEAPEAFALICEEAYQARALQASTAATSPAAQRPGPRL